MAKVYNTDPYRDCFAVTVPKEVGSVHSRPASLQAAGMQTRAAAPALPAGSWHANPRGSTSSACRGHLTGKESLLGSRLGTQPAGL